MPAWTVATRSAGLTDTTWSSARVLTDQIGGRVRRQPGSPAFDPDPPAFLVGQSTHQGQGVGRFGRGARHTVRVALDPVVPSSGAKPGEDRVAHRRRLFTALHSRQACTGTTFPGLASSDGIERPADRLHGAQRLGIEDQRHVVDLVVAHAVLTSDARRPPRRMPP